jgi:hypothetical protein
MQGQIILDVFAIELHRVRRDINMISNCCEGFNNFCRPVLSTPVERAFQIIHMFIYLLCVKRSQSP